MLLLQFINRHRIQYDRDNLLNDLSQDQRKECLLKALEDWSNAWPRRNVYGNSTTIAGERLAILPLDYLFATYEELLAGSGNSTSGSSNIVNQSTLYDFFYYFGAISTNPFSMLGATNFSSFYGSTSFTESEVVTTTSNRGRHAIDLGQNAVTTQSILIKYNALHQIADEGKLLTINSLPNNGDTLIVGSKTYTLKTTATLADDIQIASNIYRMAEVLSDRFYINQSSTLVESTPNYNTVLLRPYTLGSSITLTSDGTRLSSSTLDAINTLSRGDQWKVFELFLYWIAETKERQAIFEGELEQAKAFGLLKKDHFSRVKPYMVEAR